MEAVESPARVDLFWLPLGAGGRSVRLNGRVYERLTAALHRRAPRDLYHSALEVWVPEGRFVVEQAPAGADGRARGVVAEGPVGSRLAGRWRLFRYEVRRWRCGAIPDVDEAVGSPVRMSEDVGHAQRVLALAPHFRTATWALDEQHTGDMWNSNSLISWLLVRAGVETEGLQPPSGGRAPGWDAGIVVARRGPTGVDRVR